MWPAAACADSGLCGVALPTWGSLRGRRRGCQLSRVPLSWTESEEWSNNLSCCLKTSPWKAATCCNTEGA